MEGPFLALLGIRPMVCSRTEQRTFLKSMGSSVHDPKWPYRRTTDGLSCKALASTAHPNRSL
jgi:hypothetical protein